MIWFLVIILGFILWVIYDLTQKKHAILRNFPIIGHFRYWLEAIGPELRQYIVTSNDDERPFSRDQRRWIYSSAKKQNNYFGFGTDNDLELAPNYLIIKHSPFPLKANHNKNAVPCAKVLGAYHKRKKAFRPSSIVNVSGMSFGSLSGPAIEAINKGCKLAGSLQNTGEGSISHYHQHGGELIWQLGTAYFGCRNSDGTFSLERFLEVVDANPIRAIEIKLSQGAKPGLGGMLPASKVNAEIAEARGIPIGETCHSPPAHSAFSDLDSLLDFVELLAQRTGLPIGVKSAIGDLSVWQGLAKQMSETGRGVDFISIDGGEGGTGAAPLTFSDHVSLPFKLAFARVYKEFVKVDYHQKIVFIGSGRLGFPEVSFFAFALGCDLIHVGREAMLAIGCIQAQKCHSNHCPTGVATQNKWLIRGLDPTNKAARLANYLTIFRKEILQLSNACGLHHPAFITGQHLEILNDSFAPTTINKLFGYENNWSLPSEEDQSAICKVMSSIENATEKISP